ncbi:hypothetical protein DPSP01_011842 [Paraphaeosphaeria sporulosa]
MLSASNASPIVDYTPSNVPTLVTCRKSLLPGKLDILGIEPKRTSRHRAFQVNVWAAGDRSLERGSNNGSGIDHVDTHQSLASNLNFHIVTSSGTPNAEWLNAKVSQEITP